MKTALWAWARPHLDLGVFGLAVVAVFFLPRGGPPGIAGLGIVSGTGLALQTLGVILVLRSNRIINFAQAQLGAATAVFFYEMVHHSELAVWAASVCGQCFRGVNTDGVYDQSFP